MLLTLSTPSPAFSAAFSFDGLLAIGGDDGTLRLYKPPAVKVVKAFRGLDGAVTSIAFSPKDNRKIWLAVGKKAYSFNLDETKLISTPEDANFSLQLGAEGDEDTINVLRINHNATFMAFSCDSGVVGVIDLITLQIIRMKTRHTTVCDVVTFIPDRPSEIVSGGYDSCLLHYDYRQGTILSRYDMTPLLPQPDISLAPSFVTTLATSSSGLFAAGTADGRLWIGAGGVKFEQGRRTRKWHGLDPALGTYYKIAEGPITGIAFPTPYFVVTCTLLGNLAIHAIQLNVPSHASDAYSPISPIPSPIPSPLPSPRPDAFRSLANGPPVILNTLWRSNTQMCAKVNTVVFGAFEYPDGVARWLIVAGLDTVGKGVTELWDIGDILQRL